jgi:adenylate kinase
MEIEKAEYKPHKVPNILITGTPGTGKTTLCQLLNESLNFSYLNLGKIIKDNKLYEEWDD